LQKSLNLDGGYGWARTNDPSIIGAVLSWLLESQRPTCTYKEAHIVPEPQL